MTEISSSSMTGGGGTKTGRRGTMVGWGCGGRLGGGLGGSLCQCRNGKQGRGAYRDERNDRFHLPTVVSGPIGRQERARYTACNGGINEPASATGRGRAPPGRRSAATREDGRELRHPGEDRRPSVGAGRARRALPAGGVSARPRRRHLSSERGSRPSLRALCLGGRQARQSAAAQPHDLGGDRGRPWRGAQRRLRAAGQR